MNRSLRICIRAIHSRNVAIRSLRGSTSGLEQGCSKFRHASSASVQLGTPSPKPTDEGSTGAVLLSERQMEKRKAEIQEEIPEPTPMKSNKVDMYLASLRAGGIEPVLDDLESCRPSDRPSSDSKHYAAAYEELVDRLCRTFSKAQLRNFCIQYGIEGKLTGKKQRKDGYAEWIITKCWGWENLREVERRRRDKTEVVAKKFTLSPHELFLLLGKDGSDLLQLSIDFKVHIAVESNPLSVKVEGLRGSLKNIETLIASRRKGIVQETVQLPLASPMTPGALQQVSRLANAFIENVGQHGKVLIFAKDTFQLETAKRIVVRAALQVLRRQDVQLLAFHQEAAEEAKALSSSNLFAMYPFMSHRATASNSRGAQPAFRCRSVHDWLRHTLGKNEQNADFLGSRTPSFVNKLGQSISIEGLIQDATLDAKGSSIVKALTGHIVFSGEDIARKPTLNPPLSGRWPISKLLEWTKGNLQRRLFEPCLPSSLLSATSLSQSFFHRLTYRSLNSSREGNSFASLPSKSIQFEVALEEQMQETPETEFDEDNDSTSMEDFGASSDDFRETPAPPTQQSTVLGTKDDVSMKLSTETEYLIALPERPMDLRFLIQNTNESVVVDATEKIASYFKEFDAFLRNSSDAQPFAPLNLELEGNIYTLESSASVRRSIEDVVLQPITSTFVENDPLSLQRPTPSVVRTVTESIFDLDTNQTSLTCELTCDNPSSDENWNQFLVNVDAMTRNAYNPIKVKPPQDLIGE
ncbi:hypothetical protein SCHPADRAFT_992338 [Schizopora paradoxa]|uniref:SLS1 N-terminal domain-containing protein n=1 Tax=Schizopora paradoxa TaxID=27342 RepID=A0A0H2SSZ4_9AGAM|nr:hypothetical protein SCHPADRAFT_992338 [Schizopora paradoxa]